MQSLQSLQSLQRLQSLQSLQSLQRLQSLQSLQSLQRLQSLESLQRLQSLQSLQSLQRLQSLETHCADYQSIEIPQNAVIYCDIPYRGTEGYGINFDYERFYEWAKKQKNIYISEYNMPDDFQCVWQKQVKVSVDSNKKHNDDKNNRVEKLFIYKGTK